jgi:hypothetical protein
MMRAAAMAKERGLLHRAILRVLAGSLKTHEIAAILDALPPDVLCCEPLQRCAIVTRLRRALSRLWLRGRIMRTAQLRQNLDHGRRAFGWCLATEEALAANDHVYSGFVVAPACPLYRTHGPHVLPAYQPRGGYYDRAVMRERTRVPRMPTG